MPAGIHPVRGGVRKGGHTHPIFHCLCGTQRMLKLINHLIPVIVFRKSRLQNVCVCVCVVPVAQARHGGLLIEVTFALETFALEEHAVAQMRRAIALKCHAAAVPCHGVAMLPLPCQCRCRVVVMPLPVPRRCHAVGLLLPSLSMLLPKRLSRCHTAGLLPLPCRSRAAAMLLPRSATSLPEWLPESMPCCRCHAAAAAIPLPLTCRCHVIARKVA